eukprot:gnl/Dysnectes_brevis/589_a651_4719.p1 GENE.gnl/Dysnectes_brevis/589_a651_4719~~gnl/Dysnectes_brevis/589_a651_4719.p1  ORF type:complete len:199 (-),score=75.65 gnl/Dysnectes_brevis/589_a651_4719:58-654(-)
MGKKSITDQVFDLRFQAKMMQSQSKRSMKEHKSLIKKVKKSMRDGQHEIAAIHAQSAIGKKGEALNLLRLGARIEFVASQLQGMTQMQDVTRQMGKMTSSLSKAISSMNTEKVAAVMDKFETQVGELSTMSEFTSMTMSEQQVGTTSQTSVDQLLSACAAEEGIELAQGMGMPGTATSIGATGVGEQEDPTLARFSKL